VILVSSYVTPAPAFCFNCGQVFPWTTEKVAAAKELADEIDELTPEQRARLKEAIDDVSREGPRNEVGAARIKKLLAGGSTAAGKALWGMTVSLATEAAKKLLLP
jgi:hypothetical protein